MCVGGVHLVWLVMCITPSSIPVSRLSSGLEFAVATVPLGTMRLHSCRLSARLQMFAVNFPARLMGDV